MAGRIAHLFLKEGRALPMRSVPAVTAVAGKGLEGDAAFGRERRQVLLVGQSTLGDFDLQPGALRENMTLTGMAVDDLADGTLLEIGEAVLEIIGDCEPCSQMDDLRPGLREAIRGRRGKLGRVTRSGDVRVGDAVHLTAPPSAA
ncbi:MAG: MOSC domain-containing protein [Chloroflexi bacterium]|nr:MOSC domain-containing protein [Chloroflexota bacterium]